MASITFNPSTTLSALNTFQQSTEGLIQGLMMDDPVAFQQIRQGVIASSVTGAVFGGMAITQGVPALGSASQGATLTLATSVATLTGFTIGNRAYNSIIVPGQTVPAAYAGNTTSFVALGSGARIAVQCSSTLAAAIAGGAVNQQLAWDYTNQQLIAYTSGTALPVTVELVTQNTSRVVTSTSNLTWTSGYCALIKI